MSLSAYSEYIESGVVWLGRLPSHWKPLPFKWLVVRNDGGVWGNDPDGVDDTIVLRSTEQSVDGRWKIDDPALRKLSPSEKQAARLEVGDLLVTKSSGSALHIGKTTLTTPAVAALDCCYSNFMQRIRVGPALLPKFAWYIMNSELARLQFDLLSNSTTGLANLNGTMIGQLLVPVAPHHEQTSIVNFLDRETAKLDALIAEQEDLLILLAEKRQATLSHTIVCGRNLDAPLKESGVAWLGKVPSHWGVVRVKQVTTFITSGPRGWSDFIDDDGEHIFLQSGDLNNDLEILLNQAKRISPPLGAEGARTLLQQGDVVVCITGANTGRVAVVDALSCSTFVNQHLSLLRPDRLKANPRYVAMALTSTSGRLYFDSKQYGLKEGLSLANVAEAPLPLPPLSEQQEIVEFVDQEIARLNELASACRRATELLHERRAALITAAVTGKIDVRNALPEALAA